MSEPVVLAGRYRQIRPIGRGGMGLVWLCRDELLHRDVAIKALQTVAGETAGVRELREARLAAQLRHPNAVAVHDVITVDGRQWLVMEYVPGESLAARLKRDHRLDAALVARLGAQIGSALAAAHALGIVHRDVKPANILLEQSGEAKLGDFGIARGATDPQLTAEGMISGTPAYLAPEVVEGEAPSAASDVWAFGGTIYSAVEGELPYGDDTNVMSLIRRIATTGPRAPRHAGPLRPILEAAFRRDPSERPSMRDLVEQLDDVLRQTQQTPIGLSRLRNAPRSGVHVATPRPQSSPTATPRTAAPPPARRSPPAAADAGRSAGPTTRAKIAASVALAVAVFAAGFGTRMLVEPDAGPPSQASETSTAGQETSAQGSDVSAGESSATPATVAQQAEGFLTDFFTESPADPQSAATKLDPSLLPDDAAYEQFVTYWSGIDAVEVEQLHVTSALTASFQVVIFPAAGGMTQITSSLAIAEAGDTFVITQIPATFLGG